jgi:NAD(P)-dependent dehydrogenase (short-subunit alcohol dehydrogenase family)
VPRWTADDIPDQTGRVAIVTGANSGLGYVTARELARRGAHVVLACRDASRGQAAMQRLDAEAPDADARLRSLDLSDLSSVRAFAEETSATYDGIDLLINNAGVMAIPQRQTTDGFEMQLGTNHLGHFALTGLLLPRIRDRAGARVVTVSSQAHKPGRINFDDLMGETKYGKWTAYNQSKLANLLFAYELDRRLRAAGSPAISVAAHPGYSATNLQSAGPQLAGDRLGGLLMNLGNRLFAQSDEMGALPQLRAATAPDVEGGDYYGPSQLFESRGAPRKVSSTRASHDEETARRLWEVSEELTGVRADVTA